MASADLSLLEQKIDDLIDLCDVLAQENRALRNQQQSWTTERAKRIEKNEIANLLGHNGHR